MSVNIVNLDELINNCLTGNQKAYQESRKILNKDNYEQVMPKVKQEVDNNNKYAQKIFGDIYGKILKNSAEAFRYYKLSADQNDSDAQYYVAYMYLTDTSINQSNEEAFKYYKLSADQGNEEGLYNVGYMYQMGKGVNQNYKEAIRYYKLSAIHNHQHALHNLAVFYLRGLGVEKDIKEAIKYLNLSYKFGNQNSLLDLRQILCSDEGINFVIDLIQENEKLKI